MIQIDSINQGGGIRQSCKKGSKHQREGIPHLPKTLHQFAIVVKIIDKRE